MRGLSRPPFMDSLLLNRRIPDIGILSRQGLLQDPERIRIPV
jgi:hypothetical protein